MYSANTAAACVRILVVRHTEVLTMRIIAILTAALFATGCAASSPYGTVDNYCEQGAPTYDEQQCLRYWTAVNRHTLGSSGD